MSSRETYLDDIRISFRKQKVMAEQALGQITDDVFFTKPGEFSNSIAVIVKHLGGNLASRWTDFLTSDGEKPWRNRDAEFEVGPDDTREKLLAMWETGWAALFGTLTELGEDQLPMKVRIRGEEHTVVEALHRSLTHAAYHVGQIVYLSRLLTKEGWKWITIPPGKSKQVGTGNYLDLSAGNK
jgi:hypothetical protein